MSPCRATVTVVGFAPFGRSWRGIGVQDTLTDTPKSPLQSYPSEAEIIHREVHDVSISPLQRVVHASAAIHERSQTA